MQEATPEADPLLQRSILLAGPTAVGKSDLAIGLAASIGGEIVGADAFQIYSGLDLLTAKPSPGLLARVPHHLIGSIPLSESFSVAQWREAALQTMAGIIGRGRIPVLCGGTGLYFRSLTHGLADLPQADPKVRAELASMSVESLQQRLSTLDPAALHWIDLKNRRRLERAIEVCQLTGRPFSEFRKEWEKPLPGITAIFLTRDREDLYARINQRTEAMFRDGVEEEVRRVPPESLSPSASQVLGYAEIRACLAGEISRPEAIAKIQQATRQYAKRQLTWFRKDATFSSLNLSATRTPEAALQRLLEMARVQSH